MLEIFQLCNLVDVCVKGKRDTNCDVAGVCRSPDQKELSAKVLRRQLILTTVGATCP